MSLVNEHKGSIPRTTTVNVGNAAYLWETYHKRIFKRLLCLVHDWHTAEDLLQEVYVKATSCPPKSDKNLYSWLYQIATNTAIDYSRKKQIQAFPTHDDEDETLDLSSTQYDPGRYIATCDLQRIAFSRLNPRGQQALINYHIYGKPDEDMKYLGRVRYELNDIYLRLERRIEREVAG
jgi:RNA polymerase sigma factor (sigma-70 family)